MNATEDLLLEIGTEELPAQRLLALSSALHENIQQQCEALGLAYQSIRAFATPRRLAVWVLGLATQQKSHIIERKGPAWHCAYDADGKPTKACLGFAQAQQVSVDQLTKKETKQGAWVFLRKTQPGKATIDILPMLFEKAIQAVTRLGSMRWGDEGYCFVRPVHWLLALYGNTIVPFSALGLSAGRLTYGHRFHAPQAFSVSYPKEYEAILGKSGFVIADFDQRKACIEEQIQALSFDPQGTPIVDPLLLEEITGLVEYPVVLVGRFDPRFLSLPKAVLLSVMKKHQKNFCVQSSVSEELLAYFVTVSHIKSTHPEEIVAGNERVVQARLEDADFFYYMDRKFSLESRVENLKNVVFQKKLGSLWDKTQRLVYVMERWEAPGWRVDLKKSARAAFLCKADLLTQMVEEFPELNGIMGHHYARLDQESDEVAQALEAYYWPRFAQDKLPNTPLSAALAVVDRLDTLVGLFGLGAAPTGEKDPFALRRAALGVVRILVAQEKPLDLESLLHSVHSSYKEVESAACSLPHTQVVSEVLSFILERARAWYNDQGISSGVFAAVQALRPRCLWDFHQRLQAIAGFCQQAQFQSLVAAHKRIHHFLKQKVGSAIPTEVDTNLLVAPEEQALWKAITEQASTVKEYCQKGQYTHALTALAQLQKPVDLFFDEVLILVEDIPTRNNRCALLHALSALLSSVGDIAQYVP